ncbi:MAG: triose-phosphate isomerase [Candidatus Staskawiczbacteria bacterium RIFOXYD2_FULL_37_9]|uniref:Triosephosphate isomerase n=1 Tax=Candidatus Staskawiczbacteria bacterium RIFOXYB1_FULL_37_44 TaxID=1802223 RepID=A0A1G2IWW4_9BACT|nr:MAG: triose-phosphate isomerase [Candidatus Staskawiczbacteria bacterium RIFOXYB1_FULL_37_44]OGZ84244.1 MAG: triose-phosphate isomerase [Candidatus Staskawiczbacteria bacterium RIFOXYC1_FULL_37_52]OGZ87226.1 MAG: triose-phosphate isomerase [Candidatus Staskawiczbacteria bacterium RIFOXYC2_FULL_37_19]OGZ89737.1 MAG: triose-phosphate isomerase [Candidatus Staskawiczbacteria bacterium RIFOXYD1_FULL_37_110]OGZ92762.1 MAG: triose-phosphate isomerase [Candidatus Staskawiczbacteria bacterium RIFOXY
MKNLIAANWKMNPNSQKEAKEIFFAIVGPASGWDGVEVVICPPNIYLPVLKNIAMSDVALKLGAQNIYFEDKGAFTGEISVAMLTDLGVEYVIIGHSERRKYFGETDETVNKKIKMALASGLKIIFCVGETAGERDAGKKNEVLERQLKIGLLDIENLKLKIENLAIAYEPVWAIGTGNNCSVEETSASIKIIKEKLALSEVEGQVRVLYGGSVKSENSGAYIKEAGVNGLLVGGASLNAEEFVKIVKSAE